jgi:hypothetical protein
VEALDEIYDGIYRACEKYNVDLVGGDTTSSTSGLVITITAIGLENSENLVKRNGAKPNDLLVVTGDLGGAYMGLQILEREHSVYLANQNTQHQLPCRQRTDSQDGRALHAGKRKRYQQAENFTPLQRKEIENGPGFSDHTPVHDGGGLHGPHRLEPYYRSQGTSEVGNNTRNRHTPQGAAHTQSLCGRHR